MSRPGKRLELEQCKFVGSAQRFALLRLIVEDVERSQRIGFSKMKTAEPASTISRVGIDPKGVAILLDRTIELADTLRGKRRVISCDRVVGPQKNTLGQILQGLLVIHPLQCDATANERLVTFGSRLVSHGQGFVEFTSRNQGFTKCEEERSARRALELGLAIHFQGSHEVTGAIQVARQIELGTGKSDGGCLFENRFRAVDISKQLHPARVGDPERSVVRGRFIGRLQDCVETLVVADLIGSKELHRLMNRDRL